MLRVCVDARSQLAGALLPAPCGSVLSILCVGSVAVPRLVPWRWVGRLLRPRTRISWVVCVVGHEQRGRGRPW